MKNMLIATTVLAAGLGMASAASAQTNESWTGLYVGVQAAVHSGEVDDSGCTGLCVANAKVEDAYLALQAGYDMRVGENVIVGVMGWAGVTPVKDEVALSPTISVEGETDSAFFIGARVGLDRGAWMPYAFAGYERVDGTVTVAVAPNPNNDRTHDGFGVGAGFEYMAAQNWSVDARYMYSDLNSEAYNFGGGVTTAGEQASTFSVAVNYRFGG